jgi:hypothetical protein
MVDVELRNTADGWKASRKDGERHTYDECKAKQAERKNTATAAAPETAAAAITTATAARNDNATVIALLRRAIEILEKKGQQ